MPDNEELDEVRPGEVYFITERDRVDGSTSSYVKIGIVTTESARDSQERLNDHQTGNPRDLTVHHIVRTPAPFWVERGVHQRLGKARIRGEWFLLQPDLLQDAITMAEKLAEEALKVIPTIERAKTLGRIPSNEEKREATDEDVQWLEQLSQARERRAVCDELESSYRSVIEKLPGPVREMIEEEELIIEERVAKEVFDKAGFAAKYPEIVAQHTSTEPKLSKQFRPNYREVQVGEVDPSLATFRDEFLESCRTLEATIERHGGRDARERGLEPESLDRFFWTIREEFDALEVLHRDLEAFKSSVDWDLQSANSKLRVLCGEYDGIEGVCSWKRTVKQAQVVDFDLIRANYVTECRDFVSIVTSTRMRTKKRPRKKR